MKVQMQKLNCSFLYVTMHTLFHFNFLKYFPHENKQMSTIYNDFINVKHGLVHHLKYDLVLSCLLIYVSKVKFEHFMHDVFLIM
jgi:hypothetical protein